MEQSPFTLRGRNPDVLTCIANLSNDEVFTPPVFAKPLGGQVGEAPGSVREVGTAWGSAGRSIGEEDNKTEA